MGMLTFVLLSQYKTVVRPLTRQAGRQNRQAFLEKISRKNCHAGRIGMQVQAELAQTELTYRQADRQTDRHTDIHIHTYCTGRQD